MLLKSFILFIIFSNFCYAFTIYRSSPFILKLKCNDNLDSLNNKNKIVTNKTIIKCNSNIDIINRKLKIIKSELDSLNNKNKIVTNKTIIKCNSNIDIINRKLKIIKSEEYAYRLLLKLIFFTSYMLTLYILSFIR